MKFLENKQKLGKIDFDSNKNHLFCGSSVEEEIEITGSEILMGIRKGQFHMFFQPLWSHDNSSYYGAEVLLRWHHPEKGIILPESFITVAEKKIDIISKLEEWVICELLKNINKWNDSYCFDLKFFVNVSAVHINNKNISDFILDKLSFYKVLPKCIGIEITESAFLENNQHVLDQIVELNENGVSIMLDDFGTGYSTFSYLINYPFNGIKISQEIIRDIEVNKKVYFIVKSLFDLCFNLGFDIVVEGIETKEQENILIRFGYNNGQGYLYGKPMSSERFFKHINSDSGFLR